MDTEYLQYFLKVLECGSLNKAASQLFISQPGLRVAIAKLEKELNAPLIERTKNGCIPTEFGKQVASEAHIMFDCIKHWQKLAHIADVSEKPIHIIATQPFCDVVLTPLVTKLHQQYPFITFSIKNANAIGALAALQKEQCDIGIICAYSDDLDKIQSHIPASNWSIQKILSDCFMAFINAKSPLAQYETVYLNDLILQQQLLLGETEYFPSHHTNLSAFLDKPTLHINSPVNALQIISENTDYYILITFLLQYAPSYAMFQNEICFKSVKDLPGDAGFYLIAPPEEKRSPSEHLVINMIQEFCKTLNIS